IRTEDESGEARFWVGTAEVYHVQNDLRATPLEQAALDLSYSLTAPETLVETFPGTPMNKVAHHDWASHPKAILVAHPRYIGALAILRIEAEKTGLGKRLFTMKWTHDEDYYSVWTSSQKIISVLLGATTDRVLAVLKGSGGNSFEKNIGPED